MTTVQPRSADGPALVFIVGSGRCGSSLLQEVLSRHRDVGFLSNVDDLLGPMPLRRVNNTFYRLVPPAMTEKGRARFAPSEGYRTLSRRVSPLVSVPGRPLVAADAAPWLARRFREFFVEQAAAQRRPVFVHKFTGWCRAGFIEAAIPGSRFVHVVRDGRAVANSLVQTPWWSDYRDPMLARVLPDADQQAWRDSGMSFPLLAGLVWKSVVRSHEAARPPIGERWLDVRYEDLLRDPAGVLRRITDHAGLEANAVFDRQVSRYRFDPGRSRSYERQLSRRELDLLEASLGPTLARYGYETERSPAGLDDGFAVTEASHATGVGHGDR